jgi:peptide/nickel transport system permease protein
LVDAALSSDTALLASMLHHLVLPLAVLTLAYAPMLLKLFLRALDESIDAAPTRFRIASGCSRRWVLLSVYRRALPATVAMGGTVFGFLLGGAVVIEQLFGIPGLGQYAVVAVSRADLVSLQGFLVIVAALSLFVFFLVDITTMVLDPRRRPGVSEGAAA